MPGYTPSRQYPFPLVGESPAGHTQIQDLAMALDADAARGLPIFQSEAERDTAIPFPIEGQHSYVVGVGDMFYRAGGWWVGSGNVFDIPRNTYPAGMTVLPVTIGPRTHLQPLTMANATDIVVPLNVYVINFYIGRFGSNFAAGDRVDLYDVTNAGAAFPAISPGGANFLFAAGSVPLGPATYQVRLTLASPSEVEGNVYILTKGT